MPRFSREPFTCDREGVRCFKCSAIIAIGDKLQWDHEGKHRWCVPCADATKTDAGGGINLQPILNMLVEIKTQLDRVEQNTTYDAFES